MESGGTRLFPNLTFDASLHSSLDSLAVEEPPVSLYQFEDAGSKAKGLGPDIVTYGTDAVGNLYAQTLQEAAIIMSAEENTISKILRGIVRFRELGVTESQQAHHFSFLKYGDFSLRVNDSYVLLRPKPNPENIQIIVGDINEAVFLEEADSAKKVLGNRIKRALKFAKTYKFDSASVCTWYGVEREDLKTFSPNLRLIRSERLNQFDELLIHNIDAFTGESVDIVHTREERKFQEPTLSFINNYFAPQDSNDLIEAVLDIMQDCSVDVISFRSYGCNPPELGSKGIRALEVNLGINLSPNEVIFWNTPIKYNDEATNMRLLNFAHPRAFIPLFIKENQELVREAIQAYLDEHWIDTSPESFFREFSEEVNEITYKLMQARPKLTRKTILAFLKERSARIQLAADHMFQRVEAALPGDRLKERLRKLKSATAGFVWDGHFDYDKYETGDREYQSQVRFAQNIRLGMGIRLGMQTLEDRTTRLLLAQSIQNYTSDGEHKISSPVQIAHELGHSLKPYLSLEEKEKILDSIKVRSLEELMAIKEIDPKRIKYTKIEFTNLRTYRKAALEARKNHEESEEAEEDYLKALNKYVDELNEISIRLVYPHYPLRPHDLDIFSPETRSTLLEVFYLGDTSRLMALPCSAKP